MVRQWKKSTNSGDRDNLRALGWKVIAANVLRHHFALTACAKRQKSYQTQGNNERICRVFVRLECNGLHLGGATVEFAERNILPISGRCRCAKRFAVRFAACCAVRFATKTLSHVSLLFPEQHMLHSRTCQRREKTLPVAVNKPIWAKGLRAYSGIFSTTTNTFVYSSGMTVFFFLSVTFKRPRHSPHSGQLPRLHSARRHLPSQ